MDWQASLIAMNVARGVLDAFGFASSAQV